MVFDRRILALLSASLIPLYGCPADDDDSAADDDDDMSMDDDDTSMDDDDSADDDDSTGDTLFDQLGGEAGIGGLLDAFLGNVAADARINWFFVNADLVNLRAQLYDMLCSATGGPCTYTGLSMLDAHAGMGITNFQFDAMVEDMVLTLDQLGVPHEPADPVYPVLLTIDAMRGDIAEDPDGALVYMNQLGIYGGGDGHAAVAAVVGTMLGVVAADARINAFFADTDLDYLGYLLVEQICEATGGYCVYSGLSMVDAHAGRCIDGDDFDALVEDLLAALYTLGVPYSAELDGSELIDDLLVTLVGMEEDITEECVPE